MDRQLRGRRILVIEDEGIVACDLEKLLLNAGCEVVSLAASIDAALRRIQSEYFDAALLDINISGELVYPAADALAAREIPFVFVTGYDRTALPGRFQNCLMCRKPYAREAPLRALERALHP